MNIPPSARETDKRMRELMIAILAVMLLAPLSALVAAETSAPAG